MDAQHVDYAYVPKSNLLARRDVQYGETRILTSQQVYDENGNLAAVQNMRHIGTSVASHVYTVDALNRRTDAVREDGTNWVYTFNDRSEVGWKVEDYKNQTSVDDLESYRKKEGIYGIIMAGHGTDDPFGFVVPKENDVPDEVITAKQVKPPYKIGLIVVLSCYSKQVGWRSHVSDKGTWYGLDGTVSFFLRKS